MILQQFGTGVLGGTLLAALVISSATYETPLGGFTGSPYRAELTAKSKPVNLPVPGSFRHAEVPGCFRSLPPGVVPAEVVVVDLYGGIARTSLDRAWRAAHNDTTADDVWVVGLCS